MIVLALPCDGMDSSRRYGVFGDRTSCPLKLICHIKDVFLDICTSRPLPMISDTV
jgi:hypothetical protein